ncbi:MAG: DNA gyrase inhibitor YacG [Myxococcota bacterium]
MKAVPCPICKTQVAKRTKNFPFCSPRCKLIDAGNWLDGNYRIETAETEPSWGRDE